MLPDYQHDVFISYAHLDDQADPGVPGAVGWVAAFTRSLEIRLNRKAGRPGMVRIWRDPEVRRNMDFSNSIPEACAGSAIFIAVTSSAYLASEFCQLEVETFRRNGPPQVSRRSRLFKVLLENIPPEDQPAALQGTTGYKFFASDSETGDERLLRRTVESDPDQRYWNLLGDLARDVWELLEAMQTPQPSPEPTRTAAAAAAAVRVAPAPALPTVYLAEVTDDLEDRRQQLRRALEQQKVPVLPGEPLFGPAAEIRRKVQDCMAQCALSVHLIGPHYGRALPGDELSLTALQYEVASMKATGPARPIAWLAPELNRTLIGNDRHAKLLACLEQSGTDRNNAEIVQGRFEDLQSLVLKRVPSTRVTSGAGEGRKRRLQPLVYISYRPEDAPHLDTLRAWLRSHDFGVNAVAFRDDARDMQKHHLVNLRLSDACVILYGSADDIWVRETALRAWMHSRQKKRPRCVSVVEGPPVPKTPVDLSADGAYIIPLIDGALGKGADEFLEAMRDDSDDLGN